MTSRILKKFTVDPSKKKSKELKLVACAFKLSSEKSDHHISISKVQNTGRHFSV